jgi:hypothetical protein
MGRHAARDVRAARSDRRLMIRAGLTQVGSSPRGCTQNVSAALKEDEAQGRIARRHDELVKNRP